MAGRRVLVMALLAGVAGVGLPSVALAQDREVYQFDLPAQNLGDALRAVAARAGWELYASADDINGIEAPHLQGALTARQAIEQLLAGTTLSVRFTKGAVIIRVRSETATLAGSGAEGDDIVVTGSRVRGAPSISPLTTVSRGEAERSGQSDLGQVIRDLPQNFSGGQNPTIAGGGQGGFTNVSASSTINLRGLGPDATLTLFNGHRVAFDAISQGIDISAIPLAAIERVDVVADGASALYGSDAVAGVANIILRRDFDGLTTSARLGTATDGGAVTQQYDAVTGHKWQTGGFMVAANYQRSTQITAGQRAYTANIYPTYTLIPAQKQVSAVVAGHQRITDTIRVEVDGNYLHRTSERCLTTTATADCRFQGNTIATKVDSFSATPSLVAEIAGGWSAKLAGTYSKSDTSIATSVYAGGKNVTIALPKYYNTLKNIELSGEGPLFTLPGGDVRLALGAGFRSNRLVVDSRRVTGGVVSVINVFAQTQDIGFGYGELFVPIVSPSNRIPFIDKLQLVGAIRYENYRHLGAVTTPKLGLVYSPDPILELKASWGRSFKAPTLYQTGQTSNAQLINSTTFIPAPPSASPVLYLYGGNQNLSPERATTWTISGKITPPFLAGFQFEASYFNIRYRDRVAAPLLSTSGAFQGIYGNFVQRNPSAQDVLAAINGVTGNFTNLTSGALDPGSVSAIVNDTLQNVSVLNASGVDISAQYLRHFGESNRLTIKGSATYFTSNRQITPTLPWQEIAGTIFNPPHWRARMSASWEKDNVTLTAVGNYIGGTQDSRTAPVVGIDSFADIDAIARIRTTATSGLLANLDWSIAVLNLFNRRPSAVRNTDPLGLRYDSINYPTLGRSISFTLTKAW